MTATRYFTVDSVVQPVQPVASTAATTTADSSNAAPSAGRGGIVQVVDGYNRDNGQIATTTASSSPLQSTEDHCPTSVHHFPVST